MSLDKTEIVRFMFGKLLDEENKKKQRDLKERNDHGATASPPAADPTYSDSDSDTDPDSEAPAPETGPGPDPETDNAGESGNRGNAYPRDNRSGRRSERDGEDWNEDWGERGQERDIDMSIRNTREVSPQKSIDSGNSQSNNSKEETQQSDIQISETETPEQTEKSPEIKRAKTKEREKFVKGKRVIHIPDVPPAKKMSKKRYIPVMERITGSRSFKPLNREIKTPRKKVFKKKLKIESLDPEGESLISSSRKKLRRKITNMD